MTKHTQWNWTKGESACGAAADAIQYGMQAGYNAIDKMGRNAISPMSYFAPFSSLFHEMDRIFEQTLRNLGVLPIPGSMTAMNRMLMPSIDVSADEKEYNVIVEMPGITEKDIHIDVSKDGRLTICGEKRTEKDKRDKEFPHAERTYGWFQRELSLPEDAEAENIEANFNNGLLTVVIPRKEASESRSRKVEINAGEPSREKSRLSNRQESGAPSTNNQPQPKKVA